MEAGNWREKVVAYIRAEARPVDKFGHQPRLYALAVRLGAGMTYDDDVLFAAAWMHDLGVFEGHRPADPEALARWDHVPYTIRRGRELLAGWGFPSGKLEAFAEAVAQHQPDGDPRTAEAVLLRDADILEQLGAIGALRAVAKVGRDTRYPTFSSVVPVLRRAAEQLPGKLRLESARKLAEGRVALTQALLDAVAAEAGELLN
ncbi:MAG: HD domain-containing protein [Terracidiphilus sp.]